MSSSSTIAGYAAAALASLTADQIEFLRTLPKAELHAHLNGCIPVSTLRKLAAEHSDAASLPENVHAGIDQLQKGVVLEEIHDFFGLFPAIYALTSNPGALAEAARAVLALFLESDPEAPNGQSQAAYLELRTTPRESAHMTRRKYLETVLDEVERYSGERAALIVSLDRRMNAEVAGEVVDLAVALRSEGRRVVGVDLCGDPLVSLPDTIDPLYLCATEVRRLEI